jgi:hypothetical protein
VFFLRNFFYRLIFSSDRMDQTDLKRKSGSEPKSQTKRLKIRLGGRKRRGVDGKPVKRLKQPSKEDIENAMHKIGAALSNNYGNLKSRYAWLRKLISRYRTWEMWQTPDYETYWNHLLLTAKALEIAIEPIDEFYKKENNFFGSYVIESSQERKEEKRQNDLRKKKESKEKREAEKSLQTPIAPKAEEEEFEINLEQIMSHQFSKDQVIPMLDDGEEESLNI